LVWSDYDWRTHTPLWRALPDNEPLNIVSKWFGEVWLFAVLIDRKNLLVIIREKNLRGENTLSHSYYWMKEYHRWVFQRTLSMGLHATHKHETDMWGAWSTHRISKSTREPSCVGIDPDSWFAPRSLQTNPKQIHCVLGKVVKRGPKRAYHTAWMILYFEHQAQSLSVKV
jgi:hypothetical protein